MGIPFGIFIEQGINSLSTNYTVTGYNDNIVYLDNVEELGYVWPEATVYFNDGLMSDTQFIYWNQYADDSRFRNVYSTICSRYGKPDSYTREEGSVTAGWWEGDRSGFITLQYGPGMSADGYTLFYTTLTYSDNY